MEQTTALEPHRWTREEYDRMLEVGLLHEDSKVELLDGVITAVTPEGDTHTDVVVELMGLLAPAVAQRRVRAGNPLLATANSEPEPDLALVAPRTHRGHPTTAQLAIEVVVSRRAHARVKIGIYAAASVDEYWIVDVPRRTVEVFTRPTPGGYTEHRTLSGDDVLTIPEFAIETTVAGVFERSGLS
jgi:Uma2 family endonuclease